MYVTAVTAKKRVFIYSGFFPFNNRAVFGGDCFLFVEDSRAVWWRVFGLFVWLVWGFGWDCVPVPLWRRCGADWRRWWWVGMGRYSGSLKCAVRASVAAWWQPLKKPPWWAAWVVLGVAGWFGLQSASSSGGKAPNSRKKRPLPLSWCCQRLPLSLRLSQSAACSTSHTLPLSKSWAISAANTAGRM